MKPIVIGLIVALVVQVSESLAAGASTGRDIPSYAFRGISLGMSLTEFKQANFEISKFQPGESDEDSVSLSVCSDSDDKDEIYWPSHTSEMASLGGITCVFAYRPRGEYKFKKINQARIDIGDYDCEHYWFDFIALAGDKEPRLFRMVFFPSSRSHEKIVETLTAKYGKPASVKHETVRNAFNAEFLNSIYVWKNKNGRIETQKLFGSIDHGMLSYELNKYTRYVETELLKKDRKPDF